MNKTKIIKTIKDEIALLETTPVFKSSTPMQEVWAVVLGRQTARNILYELLAKVEEEKRETTVTQGDYIM